MLNLRSFGIFFLCGICQQDRGMLWGFRQEKAHFLAKFPKKSTEALSPEQRFNSRSSRTDALSFKRMPATAS